MKGEPIEREFQTGQVRLGYFEWGSKTKPQDPTVLMIHATGFHARCWDRVIALLPEGTHVVAVDQRGHGRSENTGIIPNWSIPARDLAALTEGLDLQNVVGVGHSMGGHGVTQVSAWHPERFKSLLLIDPVIMAPDYYGSNSVMDRGKPEDFPVAKRRNHWQSWEEMFERFQDRHPYSLWQKAALEDYCRYGLTRRTDGDGFELSCPPIVESSIYVTSAGTDVYEMVRSIQIPVTVLRAKMRDFSKAGEMDFAASPTFEGLAGEFVKGTDVYLPELSHFIPMQDPKLVADFIIKS
jgi:pimeloyl-ACP methyl ester carboxylesterase